MVEAARDGPEVFVIRMWREPSSTGPGPRRGYVEHLATGRRCYFAEPADALEFIAALGGMPIDDLP